MELRRGHFLILFKRVFFKMSSLGLQQAFIRYHHGERHIAINDFLPHSCLCPVCSYKLLWSNRTTKRANDTGRKQLFIVWLVRQNSDLRANNITIRKQDIRCTLMHAPSNIWHMHALNAVIFWNMSWNILDYDDIYTQKAGYSSPLSTNVEVPCVVHVWLGMSAVASL